MSKSFFNKSVELLFGDQSLLKKYLLPRKCLLSWQEASAKGTMLGAAYNEAKSHGTAEKGQVFGCFLVWRVQESETSGTSTHTDMQYNPNATKLFPSYLHPSPHAMEPNGLQIFFNPRINQSVLGMTQVPCPKHHPPVLSKNQCYHLNILLSKYLEKLSKMIERGFF